MVKASSLFWGSNLKERLPQAAKSCFVHPFLEGFVKVWRAEYRRLINYKTGFEGFWTGIAQQPSPQ